ncbi:MAG: type II toxin-antitoxin system VapC family toxin [Verrucomicrobia bacterium]|nr:type II toxin-antitoxin system VapC family toxin [Verrucomicrobiota bacterium]
MLVLDTDHFSEFERGTRAGAELRERLRVADQAKAVTVVTAEEVMRGWLAYIHQHRDGLQSENAYRQFQTSLQSFGKWIILPWTQGGANLLQGFRRQRIRIGSMDLRVASIVLAHEATLLTRNLADFRQVPGLRVENWLD